MLTLAGKATAGESSAEQEAEAGHAEAVSLETVARAPLRTTASETHLDQEVLRAIPKRTAEDALRLVPGIILDQHGSEGKARHFIVRGFDAMHGADFEVTLEGIPLNEWSNIHGQGYLDLGFITPEIIESIAVQKGPFDLEQGPFAMAGTARYRLGVAHDDLGWGMTYGLGTYGRHRFLGRYAPAAGGGEDVVSVEVLTDEGFGPARDTQRVAALAKKLLFRSSDHGQLSLLGAAYQAAFGLPGAMRLDDLKAGRRGFYDVYQTSARGDSRRFLGGLVYERYGQAWSQEAVVYGGFRTLDLSENFTGYLIDPIAGDRRRQGQENWSVGGHFRLAYDLAPAWTILAGAGGRWDGLDQREEQLGEGDEALAIHRQWRGRQGMLHLFGGVRVAPVRSVRIEGGLRADALEVAEGGGATGDFLHVLSPRISGSWRVGPRVDLFASYGRGVRPPEAAAITGDLVRRDTYLGDRQGDISRVMTQADSVEFGTWLRPGRGLQIGLAGFGAFIERETTYDHVSGLTLDLDGTRRLGAELNLTYRPWDYLGVRADATIVHARFRESKHPVPLVPPLASSLLLLVGEADGLGGALRLSALAPRPLPLGARSRARATVDATAHYDQGRLRFDLEVENVLDQKYYDGEYYYASHWEPQTTGSYLPAIHYVAAPPRTLRLSMTGRF